MTIREAQRSGNNALRGCSTTPELDTELLLGFALQRNRTFVATHSEYVLTPHEEKTFSAAIAQRRTGVPVAYLTAQKEFYGRNFYVDERVLVPRPETEMVVDAVKQQINSHQQSAPRILDIGTGSGCIAITLALEIPRAVVTATDRSADALNVASRNAKQLHSDVKFYSGDLFAALPSALHNSFDCIVSNPPYGDFKTIDTAAPESRALLHEPEGAITPGHNLPSHDTIQCILAEAPIWLKPHCALFMEIGHDHGETAQRIAQKHFPDAKISIQKDLAGFDRLLLVVLERQGSRTPQHY